jgi:hypothetical protein
MTRSYKSFDLKDPLLNHNVNSFENLNSVCEIVQNSEKLLYAKYSVNPGRQSQLIEADY